MTFESVYALLSSMWVVWFVLLFVGIVAWAYLPSRRKTFEDHARIPFRTGE